MVQSLDDARRRTRSGTTGRVPPHNLQAEESLLGAMLLSRDAIAAAVETCGVEDFYKPAHGHVFDAICSLYGQGEPADPVTVADELRRADLLEAIGGPGTLISLQANTPATANAGRYARIVEEHALLRRLIGVAGEIAEIGYGVPEDVAQAIDRAESMVFEIAERRVTDTLRPLHDLLSESLDRLEALYDRGESITGVPDTLTWTSDCRACSLPTW
jgi:replicative DNA helicase